METVFQGFIAGKENAKEFFRADYRLADARITTVIQAKSKIIHNETIKQLEKLNRGISSEVNTNLDKLISGDCAVAITGQQLGALGGPLMTFYKILTAVKVAQELEDESNCQIVPLFWLQSEDHDFNEISQANFLTRSEELLSFDLESIKSLAGDSVGKIILDDKSSIALAELLEKIGPSDKDIIDLIKRSYATGQTLSCAFRTFWQVICGKLGVLFFDPSEKEIKKLAVNLISESFEKHQEISDLLSQHCTKLSKSGYAIQVPVKADSPLWFLSNQGKRERGILQDNVFRTSLLSLENKQLKALISESPDRFSSSALMRPILQDWLFPTAAYICGPSEFNYWAELKPLYEFFGIIQPLVIPRASFVLLEEKYQNLLIKSGFSFKDVFRSASEALNDQLRSSDLDSTKVFSFLDSKWAKDIEVLKNLFTQIDKNLIGPLQQTKEEVFASFNRLKARYERSLQEKEGSRVKQLARVKAAILPSGEPQERVLCALSFILKYGRSLIEDLYKEINPFTNDYQQKVIYMKQSQIYQNTEKN